MRNVKLLSVWVFFLAFCHLSGTSNASSKKNNESNIEICPIDCSADSKGWEIDFKCELEGQQIKKTYYEGYSVEYINGKPHVTGEVGFEFVTSGHSYRASVDVRPCTESETGFCIKAIVHGDQRVNCQNY